MYMYQLPDTTDTAVREKVWSLSVTDKNIDDLLVRNLLLTPCF